MVQVADAVIFKNAMANYFTSPFPARDKVTQCSLHAIVCAEMHNLHT